jgi:hypothetical protein
MNFSPTAPHTSINLIFTVPSNKYQLFFYVIHSMQWDTVISKPTIYTLKHAQQHTVPSYMYMFQKLTTAVFRGHTNIQNLTKYDTFVMMKHIIS